MTSSEIVKQIRNSLEKPKDHWGKLIPCYGGCASWRDVTNLDLNVIWELLTLRARLQRLGVLCLY